MASKPSASLSMYSARRGTPIPKPNPQPSSGQGKTALSSGEGINSNSGHGAPLRLRRRPDWTGDILLPTSLCQVERAYYVLVALGLSKGSPNLESERSEEGLAQDGKASPLTLSTKSLENPRHPYTASPARWLPFPYEPNILCSSCAPQDSRSARPSYGCEERGDPKRAQYCALWSPTTEHLQVSVGAGVRPSA